MHECCDDFAEIRGVSDFVIGDTVYRRIFRRTATIGMHGEVEDDDLRADIRCVARLIVIIPRCTFT